MDLRCTVAYLQDLTRTLGLRSDHDLTMLVQPIRPSTPIMLQYRDKVLEAFVVDAGWRPEIRNPSGLHRGVRSIPSVLPSLPMSNIDVLGAIRPDEDGKDIFLAYGPTQGPLPGHDRWSQTIHDISRLGFGIDFDCQICEGVQACAEYLVEMSASDDVLGVRLSVESADGDGRTGAALQHIFERDRAPGEGTSSLF